LSLWSKHLFLQNGKDGIKSFLFLVSIKLNAQFDHLQLLEQILDIISLLTKGFSFLFIREFLSFFKKKRNETLQLV